MQNAKCSFSNKYTNLPITQIEGRGNNHFGGGAVHFFTADKKERERKNKTLVIYTCNTGTL